MKITDILNKYKEADTFSLTGSVNKMAITKEDCQNALEKMTEKAKKNLKQMYDEKAPFIFISNIPGFNELYEDIEKECREFNEKGKNLKHFRCGFIVDHLDTFAKYNLDSYIFQNFYQEISLLIERENYINSLKFNKGKAPIKVLPKELQNSIIKYEISFFNSVTESGMLMINYYFKLNDETKNYLLNYETDFDLDELQDLTLYQNNKVKFYSCTHERFNSIEN